MSTKTPNFNLLKPELTDPADITKYNTNWDIIDENLGKGNGIPKVTATSTNGVEYTGTVEDVTELTIGLAVIFIPESTSTSVNTTFNLNSLGAKSIRRKISSGSSTRVNGGLENWLYKDIPVLLMYDGTYWIAMERTKPEVNDLYGTVPIEKGGTGGITAEQARDNLGVTEAINVVKENVESNYIPTSEKGAASGVATLGTDGKLPNTQLPNIPKGVEVFTRYGDGNTSFTLKFSSKPKLIYYMSMEVSGYDSVKVVGFNGYNYSVIDHYDTINNQYTRHSYSNLFTFGSTTTVKTVENDGTFITDSKFTAEVANKSNRTYLVIGVL